MTDSFIFDLVNLAPIRDFSEDGVQSVEEENCEGSLREEVLKHFSSQEIVRSYSEVEDVVESIYEHFLMFLKNENESVEFALARNETEQEKSLSRRVKEILDTDIPVRIAHACQNSPRLRLRLLRKCLDGIAETHWTKDFAPYLRRMLYSLICDCPRDPAAAPDQPESDVALYALKEICIHFLFHYKELKKSKSDPRSLEDPSSVVLNHVLQF